MPLLAVVLTRDPLQVASLTVAARLPWVVFAIPAGVLVDRRERRWLLVSSQWLRTLFLGLFLILLAQGVDALFLLYSTLFVLGAIETVYDSAAQTIVPSLTEPQDLERANGLLWGSGTVTQYFAGPALAGVLFSVSTRLPFLLATVSFAASAFASARIRARTGGETAAARDESWARSAMAGLRSIKSDRILVILLVSSAFLGLFHSSVTAILVLYARETLELSSSGYGFFVAVSAVGALSGSLVAARLKGALGIRTSLVMAVTGAAATFSLMGVTRSAVAAAILFAFNSSAVMIWNVVSVSVRQRVVPDELLGRVSGVFRLATWGSLPVGAAIGGLLVSSAGLGAPFYLGSCIFVGVALLLVWGLPAEAISLRADAKP